MHLCFIYRQCTISLHDLRGGQRHDKWISLNNVKKGRIHLAVTIDDISEVSGKHFVYFILL